MPGGILFPALEATQGFLPINVHKGGDGPLEEDPSSQPDSRFHNLGLRLTLS